MLQLQSAFGVLALLAIAWALSENRRAVSLRQTAIGLTATVVTALVLLKLPPVAKAFGAINDAVNTISAATRAGTSFVFGYLGGGALPFDLKAPGADFILAFQALPIILVMSVLTTLLFYWRVLPPVVRGMAWLLERTLGVGGAVGLSTAANIFLGMVEAPLVHPALSGAAHAQRVVPGDDRRHGRHRRHRAGALRHLPRAADPGRGGAFRHCLRAGRAGGHPRQPDHGAGDCRQAHRRRAGRSRHAHASSTMDAIAKGTTAGLELLLNIIAMLLVLVALVYLANAILGLLPEIGGAKISLQRLLGYLMAPVCWLMGLPWPQAVTAGSLMGIKTVLNELIAYVEFSKLGADALDPRSRLIMLYAMCGFANFASLGIMIGGLGTMAPERREEINALGLKSIVSGTLTTCLMGAVVGVLT